jgi:hypothetical protein
MEGIKGERKRKMKENNFYIDPLSDKVWSLFLKMQIMTLFIRMV